MKQLSIYIILLLLSLNSGIAQKNFTGIAKYRLSVSGGSDKNTDSMAVVFAPDKVMVILYIPDGNRVSEKIFIDDFFSKEKFSGG